MGIWSLPFTVLCPQALDVCLFLFCCLIRPNVEPPKNRSLNFHHKARPQYRPTGTHPHCVQAYHRSKVVDSQSRTRNSTLPPFWRADWVLSHSGSVPGTMPAHMATVYKLFLPRNNYFLRWVHSVILEWVIIFRH